MNQKLSAVVIALCVHTAAAPVGLARTYTVKRGDSLSKVSAQHVATPVYGKSGSMQRVLERNRSIKNPNRIYTGQELELPEPPAAVAETPPVEPAPAPAPAVEVLPATPVTTAGTDGAAAPRSDDTLHAGVLLYDSKVSSRHDGGAYDTTAHSNPQYGVLLGWNHRFTSAVAVTASTAVRKASFSAAEGERLTAFNETLLGFGLALDYAATNDLTVSVAAGVAEQPFLYRRANTELAWDGVYVDTYGLKLDYAVVNGPQWRLGLGGSADLARAAQGSGFAVEQGLVYGGGVALAYHVSQAYSWEGRIFYDRRAQDTADARQRTDESGAYMGLQYRIGEPNL